MNMEIDFQLLDCDYILVNNSPVVRLFGKTMRDKTVCAFYEDFKPYFYILPKKGEKSRLIDYLQNHFSLLILKIEEEEKFLSIGFQKDKTKLIKITLKNPSEVVVLREDLRKKDFVQDVYEADILFKYRFMADFGISGLRWLKVNGDPVNTKIVKASKVLSVKKLTHLEEVENAPFKYMSLDIEIILSKDTVPDSRRDKIAIISLSFFPAYQGRTTLVLVSKPFKKINNDTLFFNSEKKMLEKFTEIVDSYDPDIICGFNCNNFDIPFISERLRLNKISRSIGRCNKKPLMCKKFGITFRNTITGRVIADVYNLIKESVGKGQLRLKRYGLGDVSKNLLNEGKVDISHSEIPEFWNGDENKFTKLIEYARKDAQLVLKLLLEKEMISKFIELSKVSGLLLQDVLDGGESARVENLLLREFNKKGFVIPCKPTQKEILKSKDIREVKGLKGALVLEPEIGLHTDSVVYLDFKSMYPSILITWNICPTTLLLKDEKIESIDTPHGIKFVSPKIKEGIIQSIVKTLISERDIIKTQVKKAKTREELRILDAKQYALKIMANAFYGYMGYLRARFYVLDIANAITSCGRYIIQKTREIVETDKRFRVVYGDTDSVMVKLQTKDLNKAFEIGKEIEELINKELEGKVKIKIENVFKSLLILTKKRYAGISFEKVNGEWKEKMIMKGIETVRRDWCDLVSKTLYDVLEIILKEQNPKKAFKHVKEILKKLEKNEILIDELVITKSISKPIKAYKGIQPHVELVKKIKKRSPSSAPGIGDRVGFVIVQGLQLMSNRAEDPQYVKQHGLKIDSKYYIESQLLPPLERVFESIGISKSELIGAGKQLHLLDIIKARKTEKVLDTVQGFVCIKCDTIFRRIPLVGKCSNCGGEILFYSGENKSRYFHAA